MDALPQDNRIYNNGVGVRVNAHGAPTLRDNLIYENTAEGIKVSKAGGGLFTQNVRSHTARPGRGRAGPEECTAGGPYAPAAAPPWRGESASAPIGDESPIGPTRAAD